MHGLVAEEQGEPLRVDDGAGVDVVAVHLEADGSVSQPFGFNHATDEDGFGDGLGLVLFGEAGLKSVEVGFFFVGKEEKDAAGLRDAKHGPIAGRGVAACG